MGVDWTLEKIKALNHLDRHNLWTNARRLEQDDLILLIEGSGLEYSDPTGLKLDSPLGRAITRIVNSPDGIAAAVAATRQGLPALAGIDPLLRERLGKEYEITYEATIQAGYRIAQMMAKQGYEKSGHQGRLAGCVAKSGEIYQEAR